MAAQFPSSPTVSQTYSYSGKTWIWSGSTWNLVSLSVMTVNTTAPATPSIGALWLSTETGDLAVYNGFSWIQSGGDTGATGPNLKITTISVCNSSYTILDDTAVSSTGGYIKLTGTGFAAGCTVTVGTVNATTTTYISDAEVRAQLPATAAGSYTIYLTNTDGGTCFRLNAVTFSAPPVWTTGSYTSPVAVNTQLLATGDSTLTYTLTSGSLPSGITLSSSGLLSGTTTVAAYSFTVTATDAQLQDVSQVISLTVAILSPSAVEYLVVAGGGGGGGVGAGNTYAGAGAGAGGYRTATGLTVASGTPITVTVGAGGVAGGGAAGAQGIGGKGSDSLFSSITSTGGGYGGGGSSTPNYTPVAGGPGGSGGGSSHIVQAGTGNTPATIPSQGNNGGYGDNPTDTGNSAAGGGAGGVGGSSGSRVGGVGLSSSITSSGIFYAGGGGGGGYIGYVGGSGGTGGGGNGGSNGFNGVSGTTNTGGGGGGAGGGTSGGPNGGGLGGSGIVIIRYADAYDAATSTTGSPTITNPTGYRVYKWTSSGSITF